VCVCVCVYIYIYIYIYVYKYLLNKAGSFCLDGEPGPGQALRNHNMDEEEQSEFINSGKLVAAGHL